MSKFQIICATIFFSLGIALAIFQVIQSNWMSAVSSFLLGPIVGFIFLIGFSESRNVSILQAIASLAGLIGIMSICFEHRAFDIKRMEAHGDALHAFAWMEMYCRGMSGELRALQQEGIKACALQDKTEQLSALSELQKSITLGPTLSLIDGIRSAAKQPQADWCSETYRAAKSRCPAAFAAMNKTSINKLESE